MELTGEHTFNVPREKVWKFMLDPEVLKACLPGCEKLEAVGEDEYVATRSSRKVTRCRSRGPVLRDRFPELARLS